MPLVGLLPAAGKGVRLRPYRSPKELLPLLLKGGEDGQTAWPTPVCAFSLNAMRVAGAERCFLVISDDKAETVRVLNDGSDYGLSIAYILQGAPRGLTDVVRCAAPWLGSSDVVFAMPDTVVFPEDALLRLHQARLERGADLALGVFPTEEPERLGPVDYAEDGRVRQIFDKPKDPTVRNCWGVLAWSARFTEFCASWDERRTDAQEGVLGHAMSDALEAGLNVTALGFEDGLFRDVGTPGGLASTLQLLAERGLAYVPG